MGTGRLQGSPLHFIRQSKLDAALWGDASVPTPTSTKPLPCSFHKKLLTTWQNGQPERSKEQNAPIVNNVQVSGGSVETGPFITAGTYHIYCTVHQGMNLQINVQ